MKRPLMSPISQEDTTQATVRETPFALFFSFLVFLIVGPFQADAVVQAAFTPPPGWYFADSSKLPKHVKVMVVGQGKHEMPPSMNLGYEEFSGTLKDYLKIMKEINVSQGDPWKDLGTFQTTAGPGSLSQVEMRTEWGVLKQMHLVYLHEGVIYILTAAALKEEFAQFYPVFFQALRSFRVDAQPSSEN